MRRIILSLFLLCSLIFNTPAFAAIWGGGGEKGLVKTGQTTSYTDYDDGYYQKGITRSYTDNDDGTITDNVTGLMWVKAPQKIIPGATGIHSTNQIQAAKGNWATSTAYVKADLAKDTTDSTYWVCAVNHTSASAGTFADDRTANPTYWRQTVWTASAANLTTPSTMTWANSITNCEALEYAGYTDWRLPNLNELQSIANYGLASPAINGTYFPNTQSNYYWSGTTYANDTGVAWVVVFGSGAVYAVNKANGYYVRPVRSSQ
jgi:hypothetical protein